MQNYRYKILENEIIAGNSKCQVVKAEDTQNPKLQLCAKITQLSKDQDENTINNQNRELQVLMEIEKIECKNIIKIYDHFDFNNKRYIIMERCHMSLTTYLQNMKDNKQNFTIFNLLDLIRQVSDGCKVLTSKQILHRDLKPDNILVNFDSNLYPTFKVTDFDISILMNQKLQTYNQQGTHRYKAPEIRDSEYSVEADVFSFGLSLFEIFYSNLSRNFLQKFKDSLQRNKFLLAIKDSQNQDDQQLIQKMKFNQLHLTVQKFLNKMLAFNPKDRFDWNNLSKECFILISNNQLKYSLQAPILMIEPEPQKFTQKQQSTQVNQPGVLNQAFQGKQFQSQIQNSQFTQVNQNHQFQQKQQFDQNIMQNNGKVPHHFDQRQQQQQFPQQQFNNHNQQIPQVRQEQNQQIIINQNFNNQAQPRPIAFTNNKFQPPVNQMARNPINNNLTPVNQQCFPQQQVQNQAFQVNMQNFQQNRNNFQIKVPSKK